jgi:hypothetical protein
MAFARWLAARAADREAKTDARRSGGSVFRSFLQLNVTPRG